MRAPTRTPAIIVAALVALGLAATASTAANAASSATLTVTVTGTGISAPIVQTSGGAFYSLALTDDGEVYAWGSNSDGQLGNASNSTSSTPVKVQFPTGSGPITQITAGDSHSLALTHDGEVYAWGDNGEDALGNASVGAQSNTPVKVQFPTDSGPIVITQIAAGTSHSLALTRTGEVYAWGDNVHFALGDADVSVTNTSTPVKVQLPTDLDPITEVAAGDEYSLVLTSAGDVYGWGQNGAGTLGDATTTDSATPVKTKFPTDAGRITQITAGGGHALALTSTGDVYGWGTNSSGQLGNTSIAATESDIPVPVEFPTDPGPIAQIAGGDLHSLAVASSGDVYGWGNNSSGQVGAAASTFGLTPTEIPLPTGSDAAMVAGGWDHSLALTSAGGVYAWGGNGDGQLGDETTASSSNVPVPVLFAPPTTMTVTRDAVPGTATVSWTIPTPPGAPAAEYDVSWFKANGVTPLGDLTTSDSTTTIGGLAPLTGVVVRVQPHGGASSSQLEAVVPQFSLDHITVAPTATPITAGQPATFTTAGFAADGDSLGDLGGVTFSTSDPGATITRNTITFAAAGAQTVVADVGGKEATTSVTVVPALDHITVTPTAAAIAGQDEPFTVEGFDDNGDSLGDLTAGATFTTSDSAATITGNTITFAAAGVQTVTARLGDLEATTSVTVTPGPAVALELHVNRATVDQHGTITLSATAQDAAGNRFDATKLAQYSSDHSTDVIDSVAGTVTFPHASTHVITATLDGVSATITITVIPTAVTPAALAFTGIQDMTTAMLAISLIGAGIVLLVFCLRKRRRA